MKRLGRMLTIVCILAMFGITACSDSVSATGFRLAHFDGMNIDEYDTSLLWRNTSEVANDGAGDGDVIYVSEKEDPVNGGWFYMYSSVGALVPSTEDGKTPTAENGEAAYYSYVRTSRSRDMVDWEMCGAVDGYYSLRLPVDSWIDSTFYAPECIRNPEDGRYYLYFTAASRINNNELRAQGARYSSATSNFDRCYIGVAVSDSPCGPFELVSSENFYGDPEAANPNGYVLSHINPTIMADEECDALLYTDEFRNAEDFADRDELFTMIDASPFFDGNGDFYLYFARHSSSRNPGGQNIWGVKMQDMVTPDWTTLTCLFRGVYISSFTGTDMLAEGTTTASVGKKFVRTLYRGEGTGNDPDYPRHLARSWVSYTTYEDGTESTDGQNESNLVEAPNMVVTRDTEGRTVYVLSYAIAGVDRPAGDYDCKAAYAYSPLGPYIKPNPEDGAMILGADTSVNDFMSNLGHVSFVTAGDETWIAHWQRQTPFGGLDQGRLYALSSMSFQLMPNTGIYMPVANGPTTSLQALPEVAIGYGNVAPQATVSASNERDGSARYLTDGMWVTYGTYADREFRAGGSTSITLTFETLVTVRGILIYNSYTTADAFKNISLIQFGLAETPSWHNGTETACFISDLPYNADAYLTSKGNLQPGSAAVATFNEITVDTITIVIDEDDRYQGGSELRISEIVVLGK